MKDLKIYVIIATGLLIFYLVAQYSQPKVTDWTKTLCDTNKIPFGTYILHDRLNDIFPGAQVKSYREPVYNVINDEQVTNATYLIICDNIDLNKYDFDKLTAYIKQGNDVFIAASEFGGDFYKELGVATQSEFKRGNATRISFINKNDSQYDVDKASGDGYFEHFDGSKAVVIGKNEFDHYNYLKFTMGKGNLYLNANPMMFTNYSLLQEMGAKYAALALSFVKNSHNLVWDEYYTQGRAGSESNMRVFLNNYALRWAFYTAFFSFLAFVLYNMKRRQRIIPVIAPLSNTTVEFATVVGQVYYEQRNNDNIAQKQITYFLEHVRSRYHMRTNAFDNEFIATLAQKSGVNEALVANITTQISHIRLTTKITDNRLIELNKNIEQFYNQST